MITFIIEDSEFICSENAFCPLNHIPHCFAVVLIGYLVIDGNVILCVNGGLYIISYFSDIVADHYLPALGIRNRDLGFSGFFQLLFNISIVVFSLLLLFNLILYYLLVLSVVLSQSPGILFKLVINVCYVAVYLSLVVVVFLAVLRPQFGAVPGNKFSADQIEMFCNLNSSTKYFFNGFGIILPEIGNCVMIRSEALHKPHYFNVSFAFFFQIPG